MNLTKVIDFEKLTRDILQEAVKVPMVNVNRDEFLGKELKKYCSDEIIQKSIQTTPKQAGVSDDVLDKISKHCINFESLKVTGLSALAGIPGGLAMLGTVPADLVQYFAHIIRIAQKLGYIYGYKDLYTIDDFDCESSSQLIVFIGIMFGVDFLEAKIVNVAAQMAKANVGRHLVKGLGKQAGFKFIQDILKKLGIKINQTILGKTISKAVPIAGAFISGGLTFVTFKPMCNKLKNALSQTQLVA